MDQHITFGTILAVEYPMLIWTTAQRNTYDDSSGTKEKVQLTQDLVEQHRENDPEFDGFWRQLEAPELDESNSAYFEHNGVETDDEGSGLADFLKVWN